MGGTRLHMQWQDGKLGKDGLFAHLAPVKEAKLHVLYVAGGWVACELGERWGLQVSHMVCIPSPLSSWAALV